MMLYLKERLVTNIVLLELHEEEIVEKPRSSADDYYRNVAYSSPFNVLWFC